jgi:hypothetical protein
MAYKQSTVAMEILALLDNAKTLAVRHQNRRFAVDVVRACRMHSEKSKFPIDPKVLDSLAKSIGDKMSAPIEDMFKQVMTIVSDTDYRMYKDDQSKKKGGLLTWSDLASPVVDFHLNQR